MSWDQRKYLVYCIAEWRLKQAMERARDFDRSQVMEFDEKGDLPIHCLLKHPKATDRQLTNQRQRDEFFDLLHILLKRYEKSIHIPNTIEGQVPAQLAYGRLTSFNEGESTILNLLMSGMRMQLAKTKRYDDDVDLEAPRKEDASVVEVKKKKMRMKKTDDVSNNGTTPMAITPSIAASKKEDRDALNRVAVESPLSQINSLRKQKKKANSNFDNQIDEIMLCTITKNEQLEKEKETLINDLAVLGSNAKLEIKAKDEQLSIVKEELATSTMTNKALDNKNQELVSDLTSLKKEKAKVEEDLAQAWKKNSMMSNTLNQMLQLGAQYSSTTE